MLRLTAERGSPDKVRPASAPEYPARSNKGAVHSSTNRPQPSVTASRKAAPYVLTVVALGLFLAILAAAGYAAEHVPTPVALVVVWLAIAVVFVRLMDGRSS